MCGLEDWRKNNFQWEKPFQNLHLCKGEDDGVKGCISLLEFFLSFMLEELLSLRASVLFLTAGIYHMVLTQDNVSFFHAH